MPELAFVLAARQNHFFRELVDALCTELAGVGVQASVTVGAFPPLRDGLAYALVPPHEYFNLRRGRAEPSSAQLARTIFVCAEQPGTCFFDENVRLAGLSHAVFDINRHAVRAFEARGIRARHLQLGYTAVWDRFDAARERDVDLLFLGCASERRSRYLAGHAGSLSRWRHELVLSDCSRPNFDPSAGFLVGEQKWELLARSKVMLNLHQGEIPYFEWLRVVQAMINGCVVVSEHSLDREPLQPGTHFVSGHAEGLGLLAGDVLSDDELRAALQRNARALLRAELPLSRSAQELAEEVEAAAALPVQRPGVPPVDEPPPEEEEEEDEHPVTFPPPADLTADPDASVLRRALKDVSLGLLELRRKVDRLVVESSGERVELHVESVSPSYAGSHPRVSVLTSVYNQGELVTAALASAAESTFRDLELVVVDDGSTDHTSREVSAWMAENAHVPAILLGHPVNRGLGHGRNSALAFARGTFSFVLDADNELYPHALQRLVAALEAAPEAQFAYGMQERVGPAGVQGLSSFFPWEPARLRMGNYIDAMALLRTQAIRDLGGYTTDVRVHGWEDYDLWCRIAEHGGSGLLVPGIVARYRASPHSMRGLTDLSWTVAYSVLVERHPRLMAGATPPL